PAPADLKARDRKRYKLIRKSLQNKGLLPAATDTGLETAIASVVSEYENVLASFPGKHDQWLAHRQRFYAAVQSARSQAEELLAAERAKSEVWELNSKQWAE